MTMPQTIPVSPVEPAQSFTIPQEHSTIDVLEEERAIDVERSDPGQ